MSGFTNAEATILQALTQPQHEVGDVKQQLAELRQLAVLPDQFVELRESVDAITIQKVFSSTREVANLMGVTQHTVQVRWCSNERIEAEKDPATGRWRIPGHEYERLRRGGNPRAP